MGKQRAWPSWSHGRGCCLARKPRPGWMSFAIATEHREAKMPTEALRADFLKQGLPAQVGAQLCAGLSEQPQEASCWRQGSRQETRWGLCRNWPTPPATSTHCREETEDSSAMVRKVEGQEGGPPGHHQYPRACFSVSLPPLSHLPRGAPWDPLVLPGVCLALQTRPAHLSVPSLRCPCVRCGLVRASPPPSAGGGTVTNPAACSGC